MPAHVDSESGSISGWTWSEYYGLRARPGFSSDGDYILIAPALAVAEERACTPIQIQASPDFGVDPLIGDVNHR